MSRSHLMIKLWLCEEMLEYADEPWVYAYVVLWLPVASSPRNEGWKSASRLYLVDWNSKLGIPQSGKCYECVHCTNQPREGFQIMASKTYISKLWTQTASTNCAECAQPFQGVFFWERVFILSDMRCLGISSDLVLHNIVGKFQNNDMVFLLE